MPRPLTTHSFATLAISVLVKPFVSLLFCRHLVSNSKQSIYPTNPNVWLEINKHILLSWCGLMFLLQRRSRIPALYELQ